MISYKPAIWQNVVAVIVIFISMLIMIAQVDPDFKGQWKRVSSQSSSNTQETLTYEEAERQYMLGRSSKSETPEEHRKNVQAFADLYNENLERRQAMNDTSSSEWSDETRREVRKTTQPIIYLSIGLLVFSVVLLVLRLLQDYTLQLTPQGIWIKPFIFVAATEIPFSDMTTVRYRISRAYSGNRNRRTRLNRILTFENEGLVLGKINLNGIAGADFNTLHAQISRLAPHLKWIYPD